jgi:hypothetical protein
MSAHRGGGRAGALGVALGALAALVLSGCGIPINATARSLPAIPIAGAPNPPAQSGSHPAIIYELQRGHLVPETRTVAAPSLETLLVLLVEGPTSAEARAGISSALLPSQAFLGSPAVESTGVVTVALPQEFVTSLTGSFLYDAYGQIVWTLTEPQNHPNGKISGVEFLLDGEVRRPLLPDFRLSSTAVVTRADFAGIGPGSATPST